MDRDVVVIPAPRDVVAGFTRTWTGKKLNSAWFSSCRVVIWTLKSRARCWIC